MILNSILTQPHVLFNSENFAVKNIICEFAEFVIMSALYKVLQHIIKCAR